MLHTVASRQKGQTQWSKRLSGATGLQFHSPGSQVEFCAGLSYSPVASYLCSQDPGVAFPPSRWASLGCRHSLVSQGWGLCLRHCCLRHVSRPSQHTGFLSGFLSQPGAQARPPWCPGQSRGGPGAGTRACLVSRAVSQAVGATDRG
jgi:hypothetical protein